MSDTHSEELYKYIAGIIQNHSCVLYRINGARDHIHIVCDLHPTIALADLIKNIKVASNSWIKQSGKFLEFDGWADGYGAFTYSIKEKDRLIEYVKNQKEHHKKTSFIVELKGLLAEQDIKFDENYF